MTTTVRLPHRVEQALATYCVAAKRTKPEVIVALLAKAPARRKRFRLATHLTTAP